MFFKGNIVNVFKRFLSEKWKTNAFINGKWTKSSNLSTFTVEDPANSEVIANVADLSPSDVNEAIDAAHCAFDKWSAVSALERSRILREINSVLLKNEDELSHLISLENGKTLSDAVAEVRYAAGFFEWFSEEARRITGDIVPSSKNDRRYLVLKHPIGVVGVITPWNFPLAMMSRRIAPILAAGCTTVIKPSELTPLSALKLAELTQDLLPPGVLNIVTASSDNTAEIGRIFCYDQRVKGIGFIGSTAVGKILYKQCSETMKKISLELGGNAPFIVFNSANIDRAVETCIGGKFRCSGQTCVAINRILVQSDIVEEFTKKLINKVQSMRVGRGTDPSVNLGPLINKEAVTKIEQILSRSIQMGADLRCGGARPSTTDDNHSVNERGHFFLPTVVSKCNNMMPLYQNEVFGPISSISSFVTEEDGIMNANSITTSGLASYLITEDQRQAWRVAEKLKFGIVGLNEALISAVEIPFGGWNESGLGTDGGQYGINEYLHIKYLCWGDLKF